MDEGRNARSRGSVRAAIPVTVASMLKGKGAEVNPRSWKVPGAVLREAVVDYKVSPLAAVA